MKEAHPTDEWFMAPNGKERDDVCYVQPRTTAQRVRIAGDFARRFKYEIPLLVDPIENLANQAYAAWPERLVVVDAGRRIAYKGGTGPFRYRPKELAAWLEANLKP